MTEKEMNHDALINAVKTVLEYVIHHRPKADSLVRLVDMAKDGSIDPLDVNGDKEIKAWVE